MAAPPHNLVLNSLRDALQAAMEAPAPRLVVVVSSVHVAHSAALLSFLRFQEDRGWQLQNLSRVTKLASVDRLLRTVSMHVLPALIDDPTSMPTWRMLSRCCVSIRLSAASVGGNFVRSATRMCDHMIAYASIAAGRPALELLHHSKYLLRRVDTFRSRQFTIDCHYVDARASDPGHDKSTSEDDDDHVLQLSFVSLQQAAYDAIQAPTADRSVTVQGVRIYHAAPLLGVVRIQMAAGRWTVVNLDSLTELARLESMFEVVDRGILRMLRDRPSSQALALLHAYTGSIRGRVGRVGGQFAERAMVICDDLVAHAAAASVGTLRSMQDRVTSFRHSEVTIDPSSDSSSSSSSNK